MHSKSVIKNGVVGFLDQVSHSSALGWAYTAGATQPLVVQIYQGGECVAEALCDQPRPGAKQAMALPTDRVGFCARLPANLGRSEGVELRACVKGSEVELKGSPCYLPPLAVLLRISMAFIHVPKTAGTSFRSELESLWGRRAVFPRVGFLRQHGGQYPRFEELKRGLYDAGGEVRVLAGHYRFDQLHGLVPHAASIAFLRDPVPRAVSYLVHARARIPAYRGQTLEQIAGMSRGRCNPQVHNLQTRYMGGLPRGELGLAHAMENLERLSVIGITERYKDSVALCGQALGVELGGDKRDNPAPRETAEPSAELLQFLGEHNAHDQQLYRRALQLFEQRLA